MDTLINEVRFAVRGLIRRPAFSAIAIATLALGIGANTAIFSVVNAVLLRPLPLKEPDRVMTFWHSAPAKGLAHMDLNEALVAYYRDRTRTFESLAVVGVLVALWIVSALKSFVSSQIPHLEFVQIDTTVLLFTTAIMLLEDEFCKRPQSSVATRMITGFTE